MTFISYYNLHHRQADTLTSGMNPSRIRCTKFEVQKHSNQTNFLLCQQGRVDGAVQRSRIPTNKSLETLFTGDDHPGTNVYFLALSMSERNSFSESDFSRMGPAFVLLNTVTSSATKKQ